MKSRSGHLNRIHGLSLVELMVALTIGLIILTAVSSLFVSSKQTYNTQDSLARLQENARFAMQFMIKDLRLAGYFGCLYHVDSLDMQTNADGSVQGSNFKIDLNGGTAFNNNAFIPFEGVENAAGSWKPSGSALPSGIKAGTDAIAVRLADVSNSANIAPGMLNGSSNLVVDDASPFSAGDIVVVSDCAGGDLLQISGIAGNTLQHATGGSPGNATSSLLKAYAPPAKVFKTTTRIYFVKQQTNGVPVLYRQDNGGSAEPLVEGVENLQILYGEDTDSPSDGVPNIYRKATAVTNWAKVVSVRIGILMRTLDDKNTDIDNGKYDVDGDGTYELNAPGDRYRRRIFQAVIQVRNVWPWSS